MHKRFVELDLLRGFAISSMVLYHFLFLLGYFDIAQISLFEGGWLVFARIIQFTFLGLVGISLVISYNNSMAEKQFYLKQWRRAVIILFFAMLISVITFFVDSENYVKFGILHLIGVSIFFLSFLVNRKWLVLILGICILIISWLISHLNAQSLFFYIPGVRVIGMGSLDYFPIFPWLSLVCFGIFLGHIFYPRNIARFKFMQRLPFLEQLNTLKPIIFCGRHSLVIYVLHVPALVFILFILSFI